MCGVTGYIDFNKETSITTLELMTNKLFHRGPDGSGIEVVNNTYYSLGFGHRRLSIIDLSETGKQPMLFDQYMITYNGEIYNYQEIKQELIALGHQFVGNSDTEMILHAYAQWGKECVQRFIGMFAIVIHDKKQDKIICIRDRAGIKPFYYYWKKDLFLFASELKSFHQHPKFQKEINLNAVSAFMQYGNVPTPHCIFKHCFKLAPGHILEFDLVTKNIQKEQYWNVYKGYNQPKLILTFEEAKAETEKILQSAFEYRMVADVPVGVFLSGGYDSTSVTTLLQKDRTEKLKTYTIAVPDIGLNEAPYAADIAKYLGTDHHEYNCTAKEALELIGDLPNLYDEPFADSSAIPTTLVAKMARKDVTVALSADAGDEVFAGYNRYDYMMRYGKKMERIPGFAQKTIAKTMDWIPADKIPVFKNKYNFPNRYEKLKGILKNPSSEQIMMSLSQQFTDDQVSNLLKGTITKSKTYFESKELKQEYFTPLSYMMAVDYQTYLLDDILQKVDRACMSVSLEGREPFLDHRIIEWAAQIPDSFKYHHGEKKYILKEIVHQYIPKSFLDRPKMGFAIPIGRWMANELKDKIEDYLNDKRIIQQGIFNNDVVSKLKNDFLNGRTELSFKIWYLLMFQMWYEKWMC